MPKPCAGSDLAVSVTAGTTQGTGESAVLLYRNRGSATCSVRGYPTVSVGRLHQASSPMRPSVLALPEGGALIGDVEIAVGQVASSTLEWEGITLTHGTGCAGATVVSVTPPTTRATAQVHLPEPLPQCVGVEVYPVVAGSQGPVPVSGPTISPPALPAIPMTGPGRW